MKKIFKTNLKKKKKNRTKINLPRPNHCDPREGEKGGGSGRRSLLSAMAGTAEAPSSARLPFFPEPGARPSPAQPRQSPAQPRKARPSPAQPSPAQRSGAAGRERRMRAPPSLRAAPLAERPRGCKSAAGSGQWESGEGAAMQMRGGRGAGCIGIDLHRPGYIGIYRDRPGYIGM